MNSKSGFEGVGRESYVGFVAIGGRNFCLIDDIAVVHFPGRGQSSFFDNYKCFFCSLLI